MGVAIRKDERPYTYEDYLSWDDSERWEIIDGMAYMQAAPAWEHQQILMELSNQFYNYFCDKRCRVFASPFDVRIPQGQEEDRKTTTVVQPDITVVCDRSKLKGTGYFGVPSMVVEILSPSTALYDKKIKLKRYERAGIREVWFADHVNRTMDVFKMGETTKYCAPDTFGSEDRISVEMFPGLEIDLSTVFDFGQGEQDEELRMNNKG